MRRTVVVVALVTGAVLAFADVSGALSGDKTTTRDAPILGVAASGAFVAATFDQGTTECFHAELWNTTSNKVTHLGKKIACEAPGGIRGPAVIGNRTVWATNVGGNLRDWIVWTATTTSPAPKALATVQGIGADDPDPGAASGATDECLMKSAAAGQAAGVIVDTSTNPPTQYAVPKQAKLLGCSAGIIIYSAGATIKGIRLSTGKTATLLSGTKIAAISPKGLAWATGSTLHWRPAATAFAPLN